MRSAPPTILRRALLCRLWRSTPRHTDSRLGVCVCYAHVRHHGRSVNMRINRSRSQDVATRRPRTSSTRHRLPKSMIGSSATIGQPRSDPRTITSQAASRFRPRVLDVEIDPLLLTLTKAPLLLKYLPPSSCLPAFTERGRAIVHTAKCAS